MGWSVRDVREASLWQFTAALDGWRAANTPDDEPGLTDSEFDELGAALDGYTARVH